MRRLLTALLVLGILLPSMTFALDVLDVDQSRYTNKPDFLGYVYIWMWINPDTQTNLIF